jgi:tetratricopeptide (TPR) repeat protein
MIQYLKDSLTPAPFEFENDNYVILQDGNLAWVEYDQILTMHNHTNVTREHRAMVKQNGQWKIASQITTHTDSFGDSPQAIEGSLNNTGYLLLAADKVKEAIEVFKLNVKLFPEAWNTYDSLGEAYAMAGDIEQAIQNYKKSIALNPDNENGKEVLAKLEKKVDNNNQ